MDSVTINIPTDQVDDCQPVTTTTSIRTYFDMQVGEFYNYLGAIICEWISMRSHQSNSSGEANTENPHLTKTFIEYFCYRIYGDFGIKRKFIRYGPEIPDYSQLENLDTHPDREALLSGGADPAAVLAAVKSGNEFSRAFYGKTAHLLVQFFYDKSIMAYNKGEHPITQLCRHMVFDVNTMSIVSAGVTKSLSYDAFVQHIINVEPKGLGIRVEEFREGTMLVYNRLLGELNREKMLLTVDNPEETQAQEETQRIAATVASNTNDKKQMDYAIATRRKIGGNSYFNNPGKTFEGMFSENNEATGTDLNNPALDPYVLVFNVEHAENRIVSPHIVNQNTLVAAYKFGDRAKVSAIVNDLRMAIYAKSFAEIGAICNALAGEQLRAVTDLDALTDHLRKTAGITGLRTPTVLFMYNGPDARDGMTKTFIDAMDAYCPGLMLKDHTGTLRSKVRNPKYTALLQIKGVHPITISQGNNRNLFNLYWSLHQRDLNGDGTATAKFLEAFDSPETSKMPHAYAGLFNWYGTLVSSLCYAIFSEYQTVFVRHTKTSNEIPFALKPPCCEIHKLYLQKREPTNMGKVTEYVNKLPYFQLYWRLFGLENDEN